ncbi:hypothetical protein SSYRP_v1c04690 [Spiroplasma syrphidicola EA-1]|uniref:Antitoxin SocA-like Panacea domain-containing protein n=1 Tax=Spiroplasma syrphidicola EA-1 TaxID=1276229 RepID=R4ULD3_9MOLU|nr:type II toxin-antitoxin system antitoxin SocA domain-containing protein [Spiroplasma syrphidicola]AGM26061.1 hypothetical protein SSYRP_v1c04690 [Spiroplasma syrphidicola EA-1]
MNAITVASFLIKENKNRFNSKTPLEFNGVNVTEGNLILNKHLHLAQILFLGKYGMELFEDNLFAYINGAVVNTVRLNYLSLIDDNSLIFNQDNFERLNETQEKFLKNILIFLSGASFEELSDLSHVDPAWIEARKNYIKGDHSSQIMDIKKYKDEYKINFKDALEVIENIENYIDSEK